MSQMISSGSAAATCSTKSHVLSGKSSCSRSMMTLPSRPRAPSTRATSLGVKPFDTIDRSRKCFGSSMLIIEPKNSFISWGRSPMFEPLPEQNTFGVAADVPDVVVAGERAVAGSGRERRLLDDPLRRSAGAPVCRGACRRRPLGRHVDPPRTPCRRDRCRRARCRPVTHRRSSWSCHAL